MTRDAIFYLEALLEDDEEDPQVQGIAQRVLFLAQKDDDDCDEVLEYLTAVMTDNPGTEAFDVAYRIWWLMGERGCAA